MPQVDWIDNGDDGFLLPSNVTSAREATLTDGMLGLSLLQLNGHRNRNDRFLDLVFSDRFTNLEILPIDPLLAEEIHHSALEIQIGHIKTQSSIPYNLKFFDYKRIDKTTASACFRSIDWSIVFDTDIANLCDCLSFVENLDYIGFFRFFDLSMFDFSQSTDLFLYKFYLVVYAIIAISVPRVTKRSSKYPPWFTRDLIDLYKNKNRLSKQYQKNKNPENYDLFSSARSDFKALHKISYDLFILDTGSNIKKDPKSFFDYVKYKNNTSGFPGEMSFQGRTSGEPDGICKLFAEFFGGVYRVSDLTHECEAIGMPCVEACMIRFSEGIVFGGISRLDESKGPGPDEIPNRFLREFAEYLLFPITKIFNSSLSCGYFPLYWKVSHIIPVFKDGDRGEISNYRGICILSAIPKLFEKLVYDHISRDVFPHIASEQHGFVPGRSIVTNLANFISPTIQWIEDGFQVDVVYTDFSKAFDRVNHRLLILKLKEFGFDGPLLLWMESYLARRCQFVRFLDHCSCMFEAKSGVPQGSHLGPLFFILFINSMVGLVPDVRILIYADDVKLFYRIGSPSDCFVLQNALNVFVKWCNDMDLDLNVSKCKVMSFSRKKNVFSYDYCFIEQYISRCVMVSDLGVTLDAKLTMNPHIDNSVNKAMRMLGFIKRFGKEFDDICVLKTLFVTYVRPILEFASLIWSPCFAAHIARIEAVQRNFSRFALRTLSWRDPLNLPEYSVRLKLLSLDTLFARRKLTDVLFIHDILSGKIGCSHLLSMIPLSTSGFGLRHRDMFYVSSHRTCYGCNNPMDRALTCLNSMGTHYDCSESRDSLKRKLRLLLSNV